MKVLNSVLRIATFVFGLVAFALFFTSFAKIVSDGTAVTFSGAQLAFGTALPDFPEITENLAKSSDILFCLLLSGLSVIFAGLTFKFRRTRFLAPVIALAAGIYMLVIALSNPWLFVDTRPLQNISGLIYTYTVLITAIALLVTAAVGVAFVLVDDYLEVLASKGAKLTIPKRIARFLRENKSEIKKVVWPGPRSVVKNTIIVLLMCAVVGIFIWAIDYGLSNLLNLLLGVSNGG